MEEQVLKIIQNRISTFLSNPESRQKENAAKDIAQHFSAFTEWCIDNTFRRYNSDKFSTYDDDFDFDTVEQLYDYYKVNVLKK